MPRKNRCNITDVLIPPDKAVLTKAYKLVVDKDIRVAELLNVITKDPVLVLEVFKEGREMFLESEKICDLSSVITNLGFDALRSIFSELKEREFPTNYKVIKSLNGYKAQAVKVSEVSSILAKYVNNELIERVKLGSLFLTIGYILILLYLGVDFDDFEENSSPAVIQFELETKCKFDIEKIRIEYLKKFLPKELITSLNLLPASYEDYDKELINEIIMCAKEIVAVYDKNTINPYQPLNDVLKNSFLKAFPIINDEYNKILKEIIAYLTWHNFGRI